MELPWDLHHRAVSPCGTRTWCLAGWPSSVVWWTLRICRWTWDERSCRRAVPWAVPGCPWCLFCFVDVFFNDDADCWIFLGLLLGWCVERVGWFPVILGDPSFNVQCFWVIRRFFFRCFWVVLFLMFLGEFCCSWCPLLELCGVFVFFCAFLMLVFFGVGAGWGKTIWN